MSTKVHTDAGLVRDPLGAALFLHLAEAIEDFMEENPISMFNALGAVTMLQTHVTIMVGEMLSEQPEVGEST